MSPRRPLLPALLLPLPAALACGRSDSLCDGDGPGQPGQNILVIVSDDIGVDKTAVYGEHPSPARTPNIDALAAQGVLFRNAYASPSCSPTRASILTGRQPSRHGIGWWIYAETETAELSPDELTLPELLWQAPDPYTSALVGKWHVTGFETDSPASDPLDQGFDCAAGSLGNPLEAISGGHLPRSFRKWEKVIDGEPTWTHRYMTSDNTDEALARVEHTPEPWFLYVGYNDAHDPLHAPPSRLVTDKVNGASSELELYEAMVEAADTEIGRLLDGIPADVRARTTIIYLSDNGTPGHGMEPPWDVTRGKATIFEGGVRVPLIVAGPRVGEPGGESDALVHVVDILPTVAELAGVDLASVLDERGEPPVLDGQSLVPWIEEPGLPSPREVVYAEHFRPNGLGLTRSEHQRTLRDADYKLVWDEQWGARTEQLYRLDPGAGTEGEDLLPGSPSAQDLDALERLRAAMQAQVEAFEG
ncbi:sulfatase-like hydrolase/transferase [Myxococcota bacterium]|nr:sulfatase-like hydrolase/transferase [Myxococcota bacterium]